MKQKAVKISPQGSLGLLALGHRGVIAWREVRDAHNEQQQREKEKEQE